MVRILALLFSLLPTLALAQATFVTPTASPWSVTQPQSPISAVIVNQPSVVPTGTLGVLVTNTVTTSPVGYNQPVTVVGTLPVSVAAGVTFPVSLSNGGTLTVSLVNGLPTLVVSAAATSNNWVSVGNTITTSPVGYNQPVAVTNTVTTSPVGYNQPVAVTNTVTTSPVAGGTYPVNVGNTVTTSAAATSNFWTSVGNTVTVSPIGTLVVSPVAATYIVSPSTSPWSVTLGTSTGILTVAPISGSTVNATEGTSPWSTQEVNGSAYPNHSNWFTGSVSANAATNTLLVSQSGANRVYVTDISCSRNDAGTTVVTLGFNASLTNQTSATSFFLGIPAPGSGGSVQAHFGTPLRTAASTSLQYTPTAATVSILCSALGYYAP